MNYESVNGCYPPDATFFLSLPNAQQPSGGVDMNAFVRMLPFFEQATLFNAYNTMTNLTHPSNITLAGVGISTLWCPSDPNVATKIDLTGTDPNGGSKPVGAEWNYVLPPGTWYQTLTSYGVMTGPIIHLAPGALGVMYDLSRTPISAVTDGTSNTVLLSESTSAWVPQSLVQSKLVYNLWNQDGYLDSQYAPNPRRYVPPSYASIGTVAETGASSMHPGGANVAMADGSVRFVKETIGSWPNIVANNYGAPTAYYIMAASVVSTSPLTLAETLTWQPGAQLGVWQALSTRNGGEVISSDSY